MTSGRIITFSFIILSGCFASDSKSSLKIFIIDHPDELKEFFSYTHLTGYLLYVPTGEEAGRPSLRTALQRLKTH